MFDFLIRNFAVPAAQKYVAGLKPPVAVHVPKELPLPSVGTIKRMCGAVSKINALEPAVSALSDEQLRAKTSELKSRYQELIKEHSAKLREARERLRDAGPQEDFVVVEQQWMTAKEVFKKAKQAALNSILPEAFALVREAGKRLLNMRHFDVQLVGGMVLHEGKIAEMSTGEGKTLVATLPAYLNALSGEGVHVVTVNDYLAKRDRAWMGPIYEFLGLTVGVILHDMDQQARRQAYACDITYGTNNEFGFDYLRDNMVIAQSDMVQRGHNFGIVDEVDSILVDEARTPLIISGPAEESTDKYYRANEIALKLRGRRTTEQEEIDAKHRSEDLSAGYDYIANEKNRSVSLSEAGEEQAAKLFGVANLHDMETIEYRHHVLQALRAKEFFKLDVEYVARDGQVIIVDEFTGRLMPGRRWSDGLHQAVEAKEGIKIERENQTLATVTFQNYFRMYGKLSGMTGTAYTEANEFQQIYNLECVVIPPNRVLSRINHADCIYKSIKEKFKAVVNEIADCHQRGQPVLVGTISIQKSEHLSSLLKQRGIPHQVLNAKYHEMEAQIVAQAGRYKAVTIATNMAGRGTDILLGGNAEFLAKSLMDQNNEKTEDPREAERQLRKFLDQFREQVKQEHEQVVNIGGLHVIGTERHESRRIDNQLRGRSGRQGDPGSSRFYVALEDDLMRLFGEGIMNMWNRLGVEEDQVIEHPWVSRTLEVAQKRVETHNFEIRKQLLEYDNVMNKQREAVYKLRREVLESEQVKERILIAIEDVAAATVKEYIMTGPDQAVSDVPALRESIKAKFNFDPNLTEEEVSPLSQDEVIDLVLKKAQEVYQSKEQQIPPEHFRQLEKMVLLNTIDARWKDHLYAMDHLKEGVGLRSYAQRDPLIEFKREGYQMFAMMLATINQDVAEMVFRVQPVVGREHLRGVFDALPQKLVHEDFSSLAGQPQQPGASSDERPFPSGDISKAATPQHQAGPKVGRNDPCPCGSGKKYKKCCGMS